MDIRVAGFGDLDVAMLSGLPLTTVRQSVEDLGRTAVELLLDEVEAPPGEHTHASRVFAPTSSSATPLPDQVARRGHARRLPFPEPFGFVERIAVGQRQAVQDTTHQRRLPVRQFGAALPVDLPDTRGHVTRRQEPRVAAVDDGTAAWAAHRRRPAVRPSRPGQ